VSGQSIRVPAAVVAAVARIGAAFLFAFGIGALVFRRRRR
jgi:hypothetical protein